MFFVISISNFMAPIYHNIRNTMKPNTIKV
jgi:hypothetical protein